MHCTTDHSLSSPNAVMKAIFTLSFTAYSRYFSWLNIISAMMRTFQIRCITLLLPQRLSTFLAARSVVFMLLAMIFSTLAVAQTKNGIDLEAVMKQMRFEYSRAMKTDSALKFNQHIREFKLQLKIAQQFPHSIERQKKALEGLDKVTLAVNKVELPVSSENLAQAKLDLHIIDDLRRQYHDKKVSLWQRFYEMFFGVDESNQEIILLP